MSSEVKQGHAGGNGSQENAAKGNLRKPIMFWSENERDAFRRNRVVQIRCGMILDDLRNERETARKTIRYEAHKFRQKSGKYYRHPGAGSSQDTPIGYIPHADVSRSSEPKLQNQTLLDETDGNQGNTKEDIQLPKMKGIITRGRKPMVTFSVNDQERDKYNRIKAIQSGDTHTNNTKDSHETVTELRHLPKRSLSAIPFRETPANKWLRRQKSAVLSRPTTSDSGFNAETGGHIKGLFTYRNSNTSDTFFDRSKAAYQLRYELRRQARLRRSGVKQKVITLKDVLDAERAKYVKSRGKVDDYIRKLDEEDMFNPLVINKWTVGEIESRLKV